MVTMLEHHIVMRILLLKLLTKADYPEGSMYASGVSRGKWKWKPVDQAYIDRINKTIQATNDHFTKKPEPVKKGKNK